MDTRQICTISDDPFDLTDQPAQTEYRIWNADMSIGVLVDYEDYVEAIKHSWKTQKPCKKNRRMGYMCRNRYIRGTVMYYDVNGEKRRRCQYETIYLHVWILERSGKPRPPGCYLAEHVNGKIYDCRRENLEWGNTHTNAVTREKHKTARRASEKQSGKAAAGSGSHRSRRRQAGLSPVSTGDAEAGDPLRCPF